MVAEVELARCNIFFDGIGYEFSLIAFVIGCVDNDLVAAGVRCPEALAFSFAVVGDNLIGNVENSLS